MEQQRSIIDEWLNELPLKVTKSAVIELRKIIDDIYFQYLKIQHGVGPAPL